MESESRTKA